MIVSVYIKDFTLREALISIMQVYSTETKDNAKVVLQFIASMHKNHLNTRNQAVFFLNKNSFSCLLLPNPLSFDRFTDKNPEILSRVKLLLKVTLSASLHYTRLSLEYRLVNF